MDVKILLDCVLPCYIMQQQKKTERSDYSCGSMDFVESVEMLKLKTGEYFVFIHIVKALRTVRYMWEAFKKQIYISLTTHV